MKRIAAAIATISLGLAAANGSASASPATTALLVDAGLTRTLSVTYAYLSTQVVPEPPAFGLAALSIVAARVLGQKETATR